ncbi:MAG: 16S rRNA (cytosine(1402)-N(4))-methyltransferase RsmH [Tidjanibacter sp.]|nr:16S rRNA (cytosine(1402)-N(4))-methyltransferase RsmH [Tidjanibacter sp.]
MSNNPYHIPALAQECMDGLNINPDGTYVDLTFGGGGHSRLILERLSPKGRLFSFDQDADAQANIPADNRLHFVESNFRFMRSQLRLRGVGDGEVDGVLADLGVSSHHFDTAERGFSFKADMSAPLDMRMNRKAAFTAQTLVNTYEQEALAKLLKEYGELDTTYKIAACIVRARSNKELTTVGDLVEAVAPCTPKKDGAKFLTKLFQALRIEVNGEMEALKMALEQSLKVLRPEGRLAVISYHSLEDRLVKNFVKCGNFEGKVEKDFYGNIFSPWEAVSRKAIVPTDEEVERNPRSRSAKLRVAAKATKE